jgi:Glu-tRNA(Gln) amidotransferase subunit E-like FAD-binding protein
MPKEDTQFKPGNPGGGRPPSVNLAARRALEAIASAATEEKMKQMAEALIDQAAGGDQGAIQILLDRLMGKPKQTVDGSLREEILKRIIVERRDAGGN